MVGELQESKKGRVFEEKRVPAGPTGDLINSFLTEMAHYKKAHPSPPLIGKAQLQVPTDGAPVLRELLVLSRLVASFKRKDGAYSWPKISKPL